MTQEKHAPLPWKVGANQGHGSSIVSSKQTLVSWCGANVTTEQSHANAAFIVLACNAHYWLVEALKLAEKIIGYGRGNLEAYQKIREALAKAEGGAG